MIEGRILQEISRWIGAASEGMWTQNWSVVCCEQRGWIFHLTHTHKKTYIYWQKLTLLEFWSQRVLGAITSIHQ